jgi:hypothetical protein
VRWRETSISIQNLGVYAQNGVTTPDALEAETISYQGIFVSEGVTDGGRTRDLQSHNLALCRLSYGHHR